MNLNKLLIEERTTLIDDALRVMHRANLRHYEDLGPPRARERLAVLYDRLEESVRTRNVNGMMRHVEKLAEERFQSGFDLYEVQTAINVLEETVWHCILQELKPRQYAGALGLVSTILGLAKDVLARTYLSLATRTRAPSLDLRAMLGGHGGALDSRGEA